MNRALYWLCLALIVVLYLVLNLVTTTPPPISEVVLIFLCIPRLHDIGKSGWFVLIGLGVEIVALTIGFGFFDLGTAKSIAGWGALLIIGLLIWLGTIPGNPNPNAWGDPPAPGLQFRRPGRASPN